MIKNLVRLSVAGIAALALYGCASGPRDITNYSLKPISVGTLVNPDVTIVAKDGSFTIEGGTQFSPTFQADIWSARTAQLQQSMTDANIVEGFAAGRAAGGKDVTVTVKGRERPLHGVLVLSQVFNAVTGPAARSYQIVIPQDKIDAAYAGRTSVAYENGSWRTMYDVGPGQTNTWRTWILWLSVTPL